jgi:DNA-nicking Smr family endonuclease
MPPRARGLTEADKALWGNYARQIAPLPGRTPIAEPAPAPAATPVDATPPRPRAAAAPAVPRTKAPPLAVGTQPGGVDSATWQRFRTGKLRAVRTLDLHGMTAQRAHNALTAFLRSAHADQVRCVEVVTGRGSGESGGVIRREFPMWLNLPEIRPLILGAAHPHALNPGSVRLILRRIR